MEPELVADTHCALGEGPLWHDAEARLYWADITAGHLYRYDPQKGTHERCYEGAPVGGFTIQEDGSLLLFGERGSIRRWRDGETETLIQEIPAARETRFNDVAADPAGRVFCGTMATTSRPGQLYRLDTDGTLTVAVEEVEISNGIGFTPKRDAMYYTDSAAQQIYRYDYDVATGEITNRRVFATVPPEDGLPDGMTVDAAGYVWSARWDGSCLVRYAPDGSEVLKVTFPAKKVSSVIFGGPDLTDLYVTTAGGDHREQEGAGAGALFRIRTGQPGHATIKGIPEFLSRIRMPRA